jgi:CheY-like chemotaxis protein
MALLSNASPLRALVVDGYRDAADSLVMLLQTFGLEVGVAYDAEEALAAVTAFRPNLVFLEIRLPGMNGCGVAARIRESPEGRNVQLIALTVLGSRADRDITAKAGFDHHFLKPMSIDELKGIIATPPIKWEWTCSNTQRFWNDLFEFKRGLSRHRRDVLTASRRAIAASYALLETPYSCAGSTLY